MHFVDSYLIHIVNIFVNELSINYGTSEPYHMQGNENQVKRFMTLHG